MTKHKKLFVFLSFLLSLNATSFSNASAVLDISTGTLQEINVFAESETEFSFEIKVPGQELKLESALSDTADRKEYMKVSIPGWSSTAQPGSPSLPMLTKTIGIPFGSEISLRVIPGNAFTQVLEKTVMPVVTQKADWGSSFVPQDEPMLPDVSYHLEEDPVVYQSENTYPGKLAELTSDGNIRGQRVVGIAIYPVQFNPATMELTTYESIFVKVTIEGGQGTQSSSFTQESDVYEGLFKETLLNYETARGWRQEITQSSVENSSGISSLMLPWTPPDPSWKIRVQTDGIYQLTYEDLATAGLPVDELDLSKLQLFNLGTEVAIHVEDTGESSFDTGDYILFYGQEPDSKYARDNVYWLTIGESAGLRMGARDGTPGSGITPENFAAHKKMETNFIYLAPIPGDEEFERWMWDYARAATTSPRVFSKNFILTAPFESEARLTIAMYGFNQNLEINPDHHVIIAINDTPVGEYQWDGITWLYPEVSIPQGLLTAGNNTISIAALNPPGVEANTIYIDWFKLDFSSYFVTESNQLAFNYADSGTWKYQIGGFSSEQVHAFDVSSPSSPVLIEGALAASSGLGYTIHFEDTVNTPTDYLVVENSGFAAEESIELDNPSDLQLASNGADHIIITHQNFSVPANILRDHRADQELRAISIDVQDIYDEFNYGLTEVKAIRDFLIYTTSSWVDPDPSFVVLMGDGHYDPKDYGGFVRTNYIPPYLAPVDPTLIETAADNRYVTLTEGDLIPDMMLGRLAVNNLTEATAIVNKIIAYEESSVSGDWQEQVLIIADNADDAGNFAIVSNDLINCCLPDPFLAEKVYYGITHDNTSNPTAGQAILAGINAGKLIVNYIGHGQVTRWGTLSEGMFSVGDVAGLTNGGKLPIMLPMTCMDGYYIYNFSSNESLAEVITKADAKGAIASWSATGYGTTYGHDYLDRGFFDAVFLSGNGLITLGEATNAGKLNLWASGTNLDLMDTYLLFGDPATRIALSFVAVHEAYSMNEDEILSISPIEGVLKNDIHPENATLNAVLDVDVSNGELNLNSDGSFIYTPDPDFFGTDFFTYHAEDGNEDSNVATVNITVKNINDLPIAQDLNVFTTLNREVEITLIAWDPDGVEIEYYYDVPSHGTLSGIAPNLVYTPDLDYSGEDSFMYWAEETGVGPDSYSTLSAIYDSSAVVNITILPNSIYLPLIINGVE